ncbi:MAG TPA: LuxR C-terminal-related transcriptional regulator, partial [Jatrophihabitans sp.]|nr:LuxR C-terminal-related transcriptional regulator [Jatrophihabitans sp.]
MRPGVRTGQPRAGARPGPFGDTGLAALLVGMPAEHILFATPAARRVLGADPAEVAGRRLPELLRPDEAEPVELLRSGRLAGYQCHRGLIRAPSQRIELWVRSLPGGDGTVLVLIGGGQPAGAGAARVDEATGANEPVLLGTADRQLVIDRLRDGSAGLLGYRPDRLLGQSMLSIVDRPELAGLLFGLGQLSASRTGVALPVTLSGTERAPMPAELILLPLEQPPSAAFAMQRDPAAEGPRRPLGHLLHSFHRHISAAAAAAELARYPSRLPSDAGDRPVLADLTGREQQIVSRLLAGDRVPAISRQLYLAQSTVRNHLSSVFG